LALAAAVSGSAFSQQVVDGQPYGQPSECFPGGPAVLGLYLTHQGGQVPALRLEGGTPGATAMLLLGTAAGEIALPGGGTLLVSPVHAISGSFDGQGVFLCSVADPRIDALDGAFFAQGIQPVSPGIELSQGLRLSRTTPECRPVTPAPRPPELILVEEFAATMRAGHLEAALDVALNSKGDALTVDLSGNLEVPVYPGVTAGGKASVKAAIQRGADSKGNVVYDVVIGADVAAAAGVGLGAGGLGASLGGGVELVWRYESTHEVARALRSMAILQAVGPRLELVSLALHTQIQNVDRAIESVRRTLDRCRAFLRARTPWRNNPHIRQLEQQIDRQRAARRALADRARALVGNVVSWVAVERIFLTVHMHGFEKHSAVAAEVNVSAGFGDAKADGQVSGANLGASAAAGIETQFGIRVERVPESDAMFVQHKVQHTRSLAASAGLGLGASVAAKRVMELTRRLQIGADGVQLADSGTTVKVSLDGRLLGAVGAVVAGQFGVGGEVALELRLADLLGFHVDAIEILLGDDEGRIVALLRAVPVKVEARGRYEAGVAVGFSIDLDGVFKGGIGASVMMADRGPGFCYEGGSGATIEHGDTLPQMLVQAFREGPIQSATAELEPRLSAVGAEVARVMQR
jgi:hypothetical protein